MGVAALLAVAEEGVVGVGVLEVEVSGQHT